MIRAGIGIGTGKPLQEMNPPQVGPVLEKPRHDGIRRPVIPAGDQHVADRAG